MKLRKILGFLFWAALVVLALTIAFKAEKAHSQTVDNMVFVRQFPGTTVGAKTTAAMATCNQVNAAVQCYLVLDPSLAAFATGTMPSMCGHCHLDDWRAGFPWGSGGGSPCGPAFTVQAANSGVTGFTCDSAIKIDTSAHALTVGTLPSFHVNIVALTPLSASWTFDMHSAATAEHSLAPYPSTDINGPNGDSAGLCWNGGTPSLIIDCAASGGFTSGSDSDGVWIKDPIAHYHEWGSVVCSTGDCAVTFPHAFASATNLVPQLSTYHASGDTGYFSIVSSSISTTGFTAHQNNQTGMTLYWSADGF